MAPPGTVMPRLVRGIHGFVERGVRGRGGSPRTSRGMTSCAVPTPVRRPYSAGSRVRTSERGTSRTSSNSFTALISTPMAMLVTRSRMNSSTTGT